MGIDACAMVYYGFEIPYGEAEWQYLKDSNGDVDYDEDTFDEWEEAYFYHKNGRLYDYDKDGSIYEYARSSPVEIQDIGYEDNWSIVSIVEAGAHTSWSNVKIDPAKMTTKPEWNQQIEEFCNLMGIEYKEPGWHLVAYLS